MAYTIDRFGTLTLPAQMPQHDHPTVGARDSLVKTVAGAFDSIGDAQAALDLPQNLNYEGLLYDVTPSVWRARVDALRAMSRHRARLYRKVVDTGEVHWCVARLAEVESPYDFERQAVVDVQLTFRQLSGWWGHWHRTWTLDSGEFLDDALFLDDSGYTLTISSSPDSIVVNNGGNRVTNNAVLTLTAGGASITEVTITSGDAEMNFDGTVAAGTALVIDTGAQSVLNNGVAAYADFALTSNHTIEEWLRLEPGDNTITVTISGGSTDSTLLVEFQDGWE